MVVMFQRVVFACAVVAAVCAAPLSRHLLSETPLALVLQEASGTQQHDTFASLMADVVALQTTAVDKVTDRSQLVADLQVRLQALRDKIIQDQGEDKARTQRLIDDLNAQLVAAKLVLSASPEGVHELQTVLERSWAAANETQQTIAELTELKEKFENQTQSLKNEASMMREQNQERLNEIEKDLALLREIENLIQEKIGCQPDKIIAMLSQLSSSSSSNFMSSSLSSVSFLQLAAGVKQDTTSTTSTASTTSTVPTTVTTSSSSSNDVITTTATEQSASGGMPGCCVRYGFGAMMKPCCFKFADAEPSSQCTAKGFGGNVNHHAGVTCDSVKFLYDQSTRSEDECTQNHILQGSGGEAACRDPSVCRSPDTCVTCSYNAVADVCYTETCGNRLQLAYADCLGIDHCLLESPPSSCCDDISKLMDLQCDVSTLNTCDVRWIDYAPKCNIDPSSYSQTSSVCSQLHVVIVSLADALAASRQNSALAFGQQTAELNRQKLILEGNLQRTINEIELRVLELSDIQQRARQYQHELNHMATISIADAEESIVNIPSQIETARAQQNQRKENREKQITLIDSVSNILREISGQAPVTNTTATFADAGVRCLQFNRPGYYYHPDGPKPTTVVCSSGDHCAVEHVIITPVTAPVVYIVRLGCQSDLLNQAAVEIKGCGGYSCPSRHTMYSVQCCGGDLCNTPTSPLASRSYVPGQCDPLTCACNMGVVDKKPEHSPYPSVSSMPSPSITATPTSSASISESPSLSTSLSPSPSPSPTSDPESCDQIKTEFPTAMSGVYEISLGVWGQRKSVYCDMDVDAQTGYALLWKNVGGNFNRSLTRLLRSNSQLMRSGEDDIVRPARLTRNPLDGSGIHNATGSMSLEGETVPVLKAPSVIEDEDEPDVSLFASSLFDYYADLNDTEWIKTMVLYENGNRVWRQSVRVVMSGVSMRDVLNSRGLSTAATSGSARCTRTAGSFALYTGAGVAHATELNVFMGRTSIVDRGYANEPDAAYGLATAQGSRCAADIPAANLITDTSNLRRLTDDLELGSNEAWGAIQNLFGYDFRTTNPRDFSRCMFRCWNGRDGMFHETFVWGARKGCPGFLFQSGQRCSGHGVCVSGTCKCDDGWTGPACAAKHILPHCGAQPHLEHGVEVCEGDACVVQCEIGYELVGPNTWQCSDALEWDGPALSQCVPVCARNCSGNGRCIAPNTCACDYGYLGEGCQSHTCRTEIRSSNVPHGMVSCSGRGSLEHSCKVVCDPGYLTVGSDTATCSNGEWTNIPECKAQCPPDECSKHGRCIAPGMCECYSGYVGDACQLPDCPHVKQCSGNGVCVATDVCLCGEEWDGAACDIKVRILTDVALNVTGLLTQLIPIPAIGTFGNLSIELWIAPAVLAGKQPVLEATENLPGAISFGFENDKLKIDIQNRRSYLFPYKFNYGVWNHVALTFSTSTHTVTLYANGQKVGDVQVLGDSFSIVNSRLGGVPSINKQLFVGLVKEFRVWRVERSAAQITANVPMALTGSDEYLEALFPLSGPLSANTIYLDDLTGHHSTRMIGAQWVRAPFAPPGPNHLPRVFHYAPVRNGTAQYVPPNAASVAA
eukprot:c8939_g1_i1.p1 GENE.c8939_g1_i1~~c8939_g1_i1.p1  ORF type:complete len:1589 (-),score=442.81 c8939_g1_i1:134-4900(-)